MWDPGEHQELGSVFGVRFSLTTDSTACGLQWAGSLQLALGPGAHLPHLSRSHGSSSRQVPQTLCFPFCVRGATALCSAPHCPLEEEGTSRASPQRRWPSQTAQYQSVARGPGSCRPLTAACPAGLQVHVFLFSCLSGRQDFEQLPFAQIASENAVSEGTVQLYMKRTTHLFHACLENRENVAIIWRDVGMLIVQGKDIKMRFYLDFLERLNGSGKMLQALLEVGFSLSQRHCCCF